MRWAWSGFLGLVLAAGAACAQSPAWQEAARKKLGSPAEAQAAIAELEKVAWPERDTAEYHATLARAHDAAGDAEKCADEALLARLASTNPPADLAQLSASLSKGAKERLADALRLQAAKDLKGAVPAYLRALKRDPAILGQDDGGLRSIAFESLKKSAQKTPDMPHRWKLALYSYLFGELATAATELAALSASPPADLKWKVGVLKARVDSELHLAQSQDAEAAKAARAARTAAAMKTTEPAGGSLPDPNLAGGGGDANAARRQEIQSEIIRVDGLITYYSNPSGYKYNIDDNDSKVIKFSSSGPRLQEKIEGLKKQKADLEFELSNLK